MSDQKQEALSEDVIDLTFTPSEEGEDGGVVPQDNTNSRAIEKELEGMEEFEEKFYTDEIQSIMVESEKPSREDSGVEEFEEESVQIVHTQMGDEVEEIGEIGEIGENRENGEIEDDDIEVLGEEVCDPIPMARFKFEKKEGDFVAGSMEGERKQKKDEEEIEIVEETAEEVQVIPKPQFLGALTTWMEDLRHFNVVLTRWESLQCIPDPTFSPSARRIAVLNKRLEQVGRLAFSIGTTLSAPLQQNWILIEGFSYGVVNPTSFRQRVTLRLFQITTSPLITRELQSLLKILRNSYRMDLSTHAVNFLYGTGSSLPIPGGEIATRDFEFEKVDLLFDQLTRGEGHRPCQNLEGIDPPAIVRTRLKQHQRQALQWMTEKEKKPVFHGDKTIFFWKKRNHLYQNILTRETASSIQTFPRGGVLADEMGLGKTLTTISLIAADVFTTRTLIVCSKTIIPNWEWELEKHLHLHGIPYMRFHGSKRRGIQIVDHGIVITTYGTLAKEYQNCLPEKEKERRALVLQKRKVRKARKLSSRTVSSHRHSSGDVSSIDGGGVSGPALAFQMMDALFQRNRRAGGHSSGAGVGSGHGEVMTGGISGVRRSRSQSFEEFGGTLDGDDDAYYEDDDDGNGDDDGRRGSTRRFRPGGEEDVIDGDDEFIFDNSPLYEIDWDRIVLDEGHFIRNRGSDRFRSANRLKGTCRWILSGTPMVNHFEDFVAILKFLRAYPFSETRWWRTLIKFPLDNPQKKPDAFRRLQKIVRFVTLRRLKSDTVDGEPLLSLPEKKEIVRTVTLNAEERKIYQTVFHYAKERALSLMDERLLSKNVMEIFTIILRLRQICNHYGLIKEFDVTKLLNMDTEKEKYCTERLLHLLDQQDQDMVCCICFDEESVDWRVTPCSHIFCKGCIEKSLEMRAVCPMCREPVTISDLKPLLPRKVMEERLESLKKQDDGVPVSASKLTAIVKDVRDLLNEDPSRKIVIFSQWKEFLGLLGAELVNEGINYMQMDGSISVDARFEMIRAFETSAYDRVMMLTMQTGGVGINLVAASHIIIVDPWWNVEAENQCIGRIHRMGQEREVTVIRYIVDQSVEQKMLIMQKKKEKNIAGALGAITDDKDLKRIYTKRIQLLLELDQDEGADGFMREESQRLGVRRDADEEMDRQD